MSPPALAVAGDESLFYCAVAVMYLLGPLTLLSLLFVSAPYGKHFRSGWGPDVPAAAAWFLMESPSLWLSLLLLPSGRHRSDLRALFVLSLFLLHYIHRTLIYPLRLRRLRSRVPLSVASIAFAFNLLNAYIQTRSASHYADYGDGAVRMGIGLGIFFWGMAVNIRSDLALLRLKAESGGQYRIPRGGWFETVSCPNYMGEVAEWLGWAVVAWSPAAFGFLFFTAANLLPRARSHHRWYLHKFGADYPRSRKSILPYIF